MVTQWLCFIPDYDYATHYLVGFTRSVLLSLFCFISILLTSSLRLWGFMILLFIILLLDLGAVLSTDLYWLFVSFRYEYTITLWGYPFNYYLDALYHYYEVICVLLILYNWNNRNPNGLLNNRPTAPTYHHDFTVWLHSTTSNKSGGTCEKDTKRKNKVYKK